MDSLEATLQNRYESADISLEPPRVEHGANIHRLISECPPLDLNSTYAYLLLCQHFADTCVRAVHADRTVGFISAYRIPGREDVLFVWQVAVAEEARGRGLAKHMLIHLLSRGAAKACDRLETTVSPSNSPSRALFRSLAHDMGAPLTEEPLFSQSHFGKNGHESETLIRIGPFERT